MNIFEGTRRIALLIGAFWAICVISIHAVWDQSVRLEYVVTSPDIVVRVHKDKCNFDDSDEWQYTTTSNETKLAVHFCFKAQKFTNGEMLVPIWIDRKKSQIVGSSKFSAGTKNYTKRFASEFKIPATDIDWADGQKWPVRLEKTKDGALWVVGGWLILWLLTANVGWIVRGFFRIPHGKDSAVE